MAERAHPEDSGFQKGSVYRENFFKRYAFACKYTVGKNILDIPCGVGWGTSLLSAKSKIGIDISPEAIDYAKANYKEINFLVGNMNNIPLSDNSIDIIVCLEGYEHVTKEIGLDFLGEAARILKREGLLILSCPIIPPKGKHSGNPYHLYEPTKKEIDEILSLKFTQIKSELFQGPDNLIMYFIGKPLTGENA